MSVKERTWLTAKGKRVALQVDVKVKHPDGTVQRVRRFCPTLSRADARRMEKAIRRAIQNRQPVPTFGDAGAIPDEFEKPTQQTSAPIKSVPSVREFWAEFIGLAEASNRPSEIHNKRKAGNYFLALFGAKRLDEIGSRELEHFKAKLLKGDEDRQWKALKPKSARNYLYIIKRMLRVAKRFKLVAEVPETDPIEVPPPEFRFFTKEEGSKLVAAADREWQCMLLVALRTGLRVGELLGLRWQDVDLIGARINVRKAAHKGKLGPPKTRSSIREVPLSDDALAALKRHRHLRAFVFSKADGSMFLDTEARRPLERACRKAGLPEVGWHVLRHSFASQLVMAGAPLKAVSELLGHTTIQMTMRYAHLSPVARREAVLLLDSTSPRTTSSRTEG